MKYGIWNITLNNWVNDFDSDNLPPHNRFEAPNKEFALFALARIKDLENCFILAMRRRRCEFEIRKIEDEN